MTSQPSAAKALNVNWIMLLIVSIGAWLRWLALSPMRYFLLYDEAYNGIDVLSLLHNPRLTPFFPNNFGRESGWMYILSPFVGTFGTQPFAMRLAATMMGVLTLVAVYALGRELIGQRGAIWGTAVLAVLYWPVQISTLALRANLMPLVGALAFAVFWRTLRTNRLLHWSLTGVLIGALAYTYFSARVWIGLQAAILIGLAILNRKLRRGGLIALLIVAVIAAPLIVYTLMNPDVALNRISEVGLTDVAAITHNIGLWVQAFFSRGDSNFTLNLPGRPIFDPFLGVLFLIGLFALPIMIKRRWQLLWLAVVALTAVSPSLLSGDAPHFLRAIGLIVPIAIIAGAGAAGVERMAQRIMPAHIALLLPVGLMAIGGLITYNDFYSKWLNRADVATYMGQADNQLAEFLKSKSTDATPLYIPFEPFAPWNDPRTLFRAAYLSPRPTAIFDWRQCWVAADVPAIYATPIADRLDFMQGLSQFELLQSIEIPTDRSDLANNFGVFKSTPRLDDIVPANPSTTTFGDRLRLTAVPTIPVTFHAGDSAAIRFAAKALQSIDRDYSVFIHLDDASQPEASGKILSQGDSQLCASYPSSFWKVHENVIQDFVLPIPADAPAGDYVITVGLYDSASLARLPITSAASAPDYFELQHIKIEP